MPRRRKMRLKRLMLFKSITGPSSKNAKSAPGVTIAAKPKAKKASTLEHTLTTTASSIKLSTDSVGAWPTARKRSRGISV